ncbi:glycerophosphodiester phosphodiesterase [Streptomyces sp. NBC_00316]|uniref:glycerophosphodiester phosphodiesterase n=1 Tax=Streptomyces sp. NBC_00316 TaxID=2975710 RepID=UPI002E2DD366|nr:glycerophosphodiester phosphodiesterase family protein [Streptomyces sp. NBC_00316]
MLTRIYICVAGMVLGLAAVLLVTSTATDAPDRDGVASVAHRAGAYRAPENTLAAVDAARAVGIDWLENDVQRTKDGTLVVIHDKSLARTTDVEKKIPHGAPWNVADFTWAEISTLDAGSWKGRQWAGEKIPTLQQYMRRVDSNDQRLVLEIKWPELYPRLTEDTLNELDRLGWLKGDRVTDRLIVQAFDTGTLKTVRARAPEVRTALLSRDPVAKDLPRYAEVADQIHMKYLKVTPEYFKAVHALKGPHGRRLKVFLWTVDDPRRAVEFARWGADGFISNRPDLLQKALAEAGYTADVKD